MERRCLNHAFWQRRSFAFAGTLLVLLLISAGAVFAMPVTGRETSEALPETLLVNPGFEGVEGPGSWTRATYVGEQTYVEIATPEGWVTWWSELGEYQRPESRVIPFEPPYAVHSGYYAAQISSYPGAHDGGYFQVVHGLPPGSTVAFAAYAQAPDCLGASEDGRYDRVYLPALQFQVGLGPGAALAWDSIAWSRAQPACDSFQPIGPVSAQVGADGSVTVYLRSVARWPGDRNVARWDDASLSITVLGAVTEPAPGTAAPEPVPGLEVPPTTVADAGTAPTYVVQPGDTLYGIAFEHGIDFERFLQWNNLSAEDTIWPDQQLIVAMPTASAPVTTPNTPTPTVQAAAEGGEETRTRICVSAFHDRDGNAAYDVANEELLGGAGIAIYNAQGVLSGQYVTPADNTPQCFEGLLPGIYRLSATAPVGFELACPADINVALGTGTTLELALANRALEAGTEADAAGSAPSGEQAQSYPTWVLGIGSAVLILLLAVGSVALLLLRRRT